MNGGDGWSVVGAGDVDGDVLCGGAALAVCDGDGEDGVDGFASGEEVEIALSDGIGPSDGAVVGIGLICGNREGSLDSGLLSSGEG